MLKNTRKNKKNLRPIEPICGNCMLYDSAERRCKVTILHEGERFELETDPEQHCLYDQKYITYQKNHRTGKREKKVFKPEVQETRFWVEDAKTHEPTKGDGIVKIQYSEGFFGNEDHRLEYLEE